jgi:uncharacterized protein with von Willebrand factor type A (vWA) domain
MKKMSTKLQLSTTTVRVLQDGALVAVRGGIGGPGGSSDHPWACVGVNYSGDVKAPAKP